jgi:hypothetical protein
MNIEKFKGVALNDPGQVRNLFKSLHLGAIFVSSEVGSVLNLRRGSRECYFQYPRNWLRGEGDLRFGHQCVMKVSSHRKLTENYHSETNGNFSSQTAGATVYEVYENTTISKSFALLL